MKRVFAVAAFLLFSSLSFAQTDYKGHLYLFFAPGASVSHGNSSGTIHFGGGGDIFVVNALALSPELGYLAPTRGLADGFGVLSADASLHFRRDRGVVPFVTGGYSLAFRSGHANGGNFGGGVTWWPKKKLGVRLEFRDHYFTELGDAHLIGFRIGLALR